MNISIVKEFFTNQGGVSEGVYSSRNCGPGSHDDSDAVIENRRRCAHDFGVDISQLCTLYQIHSAEVVTIRRPWGLNETPPQADAMVSATPNIMLGILTADCTPVLFADEKVRIIGAAHAGWKGALGGVLENTVTAMEALGSKRADINAYIGPSIQQKSYEVSKEFRANFISADKANAQFFAKGSNAQHFQFNLPAYVAHRLLTIGLNHIHDCAEDTLSQLDKYFSYRRKCLKNEADYGRQLSAIMMKAEEA